MADLDFININDCSDVSVETPQSLFIDYMSKNQVKDFSDIKKYVITYSQNNNCNSSNGEGGTITVPPNYQLQVEIVACESCLNLSLNPASCYTVRLTGIKSSLITQLSFCAGLICFSQGFTVIDEDTIEFQPLPCQTGDSTREHRITTTEGFQYYFQFDFIGQTTDTSCDGTIDNFEVTYILPSIVETPSSSISLNDLFEQVVLFPANYYIQICEIDINNVQTCISNEEFLDCDSIFDCEFEEICDSTDNVCNLTKEIQQKHQSIIYGLKCCKEIDERILKHWIKLFCPTALEPSC